MSFRSLPRPSSSLNAKASTVCPYLLDLRSHLFAHSFVAPRKRRRSRLRLRLPPLSPVRLALHENLLARGAAFRCAPVFACSVILDVLNPKMFVKTGVFRHSFSCHFFFCVVFKEHFASIFSAWLRCCSKTLVRVDDYAFLAFPSLRLAIRKISSQKPLP